VHLHTVDVAGDLWGPLAMALATCAVLATDRLPAAATLDRIQLDHLVVCWWKLQRPQHGASLCSACDPFGWAATAGMATSWLTCDPFRGNDRFHRAQPFPNMAMEGPDHEQRPYDP